MESKPIDKSTRRRFLKGLTVGGIGAAGALTVSRAVTALPGAGIGGVTISDADIDAKRIAGVRIASEFAPEWHAGTDIDPWPGSAIQNAINDVPSTGGIVYIPQGSWLLSSDIIVRGKNNLTIMGAGKATRLFNTGSARFFFDGGSTSLTALQGLHLTRFQFDPTQMSVISGTNPVRLRNCVDSRVSGCWFRGHPNNAVSVLLVEGGAKNSVIDNNFVADFGGAQLQCNPLGGTANNALIVANNHLDSSNMLIIGWNKVLISNNLLTNQLLGNSIYLGWSSTGLGTNNGITVVGNVVDCGTGNNATIQGIAQTPGNAGFINDLIIVGNHVRGLIAKIVMDDTNSTGSLTHSRVLIAGNALRASSTGAGNCQIDIRGYNTSVSDVLVAFNRLSGGSTPAVSTDAATSDARIYGNKGVPSPGVSAISVGASPFTYTNNDFTPEAVYISGGTVSNISKDSMTIFQGTPATVWLEPGESVTVTYGVAPTVTKDRK